MSEIQKGIKLTLNALIELNDDKVMALCDEIEKLRQENTALMGTNKELRSENEALQAKLAEADDQHKVVMEKLKDEHHQDIKRLENRLDTEMDRVIVYQKALAGVGNRKEIAENENKKWATKWKNQNIEIFTDILHRYGCLAAWGTALNFPDITDFRKEKGLGVKTKGSCMDIYDFQFEKCKECKNSYSTKCQKIRMTKRLFPVRSPAPLNITNYNCFDYSAFDDYPKLTFNKYL